MKKQVFSLLVNNNTGLLSRVAGLFSRRGYNIDSITSGTTMNKSLTRITVVATGDVQILSQIEKQLAKLEDVVDIKILKDGESVCRELIMLKVRKVLQWVIWKVFLLSKNIERTDMLGNFFALVKCGQRKLVVASLPVIVSWII